MPWQCSPLVGGHLTTGSTGWSSSASRCRRQPQSLLSQVKDSGVESLLARTRGGSDVPPLLGFAQAACVGAVSQWARTWRW